MTSDAKHKEMVQALSEVMKKLCAQKGIKIRSKKNVPLFWCYDLDPDLLVRELNGVQEVGTLKPGGSEFVVKFPLNHKKGN